jgi:hypothetical protein
MVSNTCIHLEYFLFFCIVKTKPVDAAIAKRDEFSQKTKETLARRAGYRCSICQAATIGPHSNPDRVIFLGEASHIHSAAGKGPRANAALSTEERGSASNGIHLCKIHARLIDVDETNYPADKLRQIKHAHEQQIRSMLVGESTDYDSDFLNSHETQIVHGRGNPTLVELWTPRHVIQPQAGSTPIKHDATKVIASESGVFLIIGDQITGRTSLLKRMAADALGGYNCVWLNGRQLTESAIKDPIKALALGYKMINASADGWQTFVEAENERNLVFIDDLHLSTLNIATKRKFLCLLQSLAHSIIVTVSDPFIIELLSVSPNDGLRLHQWRLIDLSRADCAHLVKLWCNFGAESVSDHVLDARIATTYDQLEVLFGRKLMPRQPFFVLTALQSIDAGAPMDTAVGSFGGVYETVIHLAISKNAANQAAISSERAYLQELAYWCEFQPSEPNRNTFNQWFAEKKGINLKRVNDLETSLAIKGFLSRHHQGFRFNYQKYYFLASYLRDNPSRAGIRDYISNLIINCWNEDYANIALFLAYLQPSSFLVEALLNEVKRLFKSHLEFDAKGWSVNVQFPEGFFKGLTFTTDPESNRKLLAERLDETNPLGSSECDMVAVASVPDKDDELFMDFLKSFHLIKLTGQLIRNSPIAFDADQKRELIEAGFNLSLRLVTFLESVCSPESLQIQALNELKTRVLTKTSRAEIEAKLSGLIYNLSLFMAFTPLRHACYYLAHPDLRLIYRDVLNTSSPKGEALSQKILACGLNFELRSPDSDLLGNVYRELTPAGQDILHMWTWFHLSFNRVHVTKRQAILDSVGMSTKIQLLLPKGD